MKHGKSWPVSVLFGVLLNVFTAPLIACTCAGTIAGRHACNEAGRFAVVFTGKVEQIERVFHPVAANVGPETLLVKFQEIEAFRGISNTSTEVEVHTGLGGGDCGYPFTRGEKYIIYAARNKSDEFWTGVCTLTRPVSRAQEDLDYFKGLQLPAVNGWVQGRILIRRANGMLSADGVTGARVTATAPNGSSKDTEISDLTGAFKISNLAPGQYTITASKPDYSVVYQLPYKATVPPKGCALVEILLAGSAPQK